VSISKFFGVCLQLGEIARVSLSELGDADILRPVAQNGKSILHIGSRELIVQLRDKILALHGYEVVSTLALDQAITLFEQRPFDLVLVDVEGQERVPQAVRLCDEIRALHPGQRVGFVCNYQVSIDSDCPDEIIRAEFNPVAFVDGVKGMLE